MVNISRIESSGSDLDLVNKIEKYDIAESFKNRIYKLLSVQRESCLPRFSSNSEAF